MTQKKYLLFLSISYLLFLPTYFLLNYFINKNSGSSVLIANIGLLSNLTNIKQILVAIFVFFLLFVVIFRLKSLRMKFIWGVLMFIPGLNFLFSIILAFFKDKQ